jgi:hypothetical protein
MDYGVLARKRRFRTGAAESATSPARDGSGRWKVRHARSVSSATPYGLSLPFFASLSLPCLACACSEGTSQSSSSKVRGTVNGWVGSEIWAAVSAGGSWEDARVGSDFLQGALAVPRPSSQPHSERWRTWIAPLCRTWTCSMESAMTA